MSMLGTGARSNAGCAYASVGGGLLLGASINSPASTNSRSLGWARLKA